MIINVCFMFLVYVFLCNIFGVYVVMFQCVLLYFVCMFTCDVLRMFQCCVAIFGVYISLCFSVIFGV